MRAISEIVMFYVPGSHEGTIMLAYVLLMLIMVADTLHILMMALLMLSGNPLPLS